LKALLLKYWERLRSSFWFLPAAMACLAIALASATVALDRAVTDGWLARLGWRYSGGAEGASLMLSTVAGSMIAIAGTVFSMTLVAMSLASSQLGPRLLRNFMRDTAFNQIRQSARSNPVVAIRMLDAIARIAGHVRSAPDAACLRRHADMIVRGAREAVPEAGDRLDVEARYLAATTALRELHGALGDEAGR